MANSVILLDIAYSGCRYEAKVWFARHSIQIAYFSNQQDAEYWAQYVDEEIKLQLAKIAWHNAFKADVLHLINKRRNLI